MTLEQRIQALIDQMPTIDQGMRSDVVPYATIMWVQDLLAMARLRYGDSSSMFGEVAKMIKDLKSRSSAMTYAWASLMGVALALQKDLAMEKLDIEGQTEITSEGFFIEGQTFDALYKIHVLVRSATSTIDLVDGYLSPELLDLLAAKNGGVGVQIITQDNKHSQGIKSLVPAFRTQHGSLEIRLSKAFHDRFLILDRKEYYHFGHSLKDAGKKAFMFSRIEERLMVAAMQKCWDDEWLNGTPLV